MPIAATVAIGLVYPVTSMKTWIDFMNPAGDGPGWTGLSPHGTQPFLLDLDNPDANTAESIDDVAAIRWLQENARPGDVCLRLRVAGTDSLRATDKPALYVHWYPDGYRQEWARGSVARRTA